MEFRLTWSERVTPSGRRYSRLVASARRSDETDYSLWPAPKAMDATGVRQSVGNAEKRRGGDNLNYQSTRGVNTLPSDARTEIFGALAYSPGHGQWLMGFHDQASRSSPNWSDWELIQRLLNEHGGASPAFWRALAGIALGELEPMETQSCRKSRQCSSGP